MPQFSVRRLWLGKVDIFNGDSMKIRKYLPVIVLSYLLFFMIAFVTGLQNPLGAILMSQYDVSVGVAQLGNFANFIAYFCMGIPAGLMLKKYGYKFSLLVAATVGIIGIGLMFFSGQISRGLWLYFTGAFVAGFSMCMLNAVVNPLLNSLGGGGKKGNQLIQWGGSLNSIAATIVPFVVGFLMGRSAGALAAGGHPHFEIADVNPMFIILVSIFAVAILAILFVDIPEAETFETRDALQQIIGNREEKYSCFSFRHFILGSVAVFLYTGIEVSIANMTNIYLIHEVGVTPPSAGAIVAFYWFFMFVGRLVGGTLGSKFSSRDMLQFSSVMAMILILITIFTPEKITISVGRYSLGNIPVNIVFLVLTGLFTSVMWGNIYNLSVEGLGKYTSTATGFFMMMVCGGGIVPLLQGLLADFVGCRASFWLIILCLGYLMYYGSTGYKNVNRKIPVQ